MTTQKPNRLVKMILVSVMVSVVISISLIGCGSDSTPADTGWPLTGNLFAHDPTIIKAGSTWYLFYTGNGVQMKTSPDGRNWSNPSRVFPGELSWWSEYANYDRNNSCWAPDIFFYNNKYWLYYSVSVFGKRSSVIGLASCTDLVTGKWVDEGAVIYSIEGDPVNKYNCIDPNVVEDQDGNLWLSFGSWGSGIYAVQLNKTTMKPAAAKPADDPTLTQLAYRPSVVTSVDPNGTKQAMECPSIIYHNGYYYLFVSFDICCQGSNSTYKIAYGRSTSVTGPYIDKTGRAMTNSGGTILDQDDGRWIPGGQFMYKNGSQWLCVHHAYDKKNGGIATLRIKNLYFDSQGWPTYTPQ